MNLEEFESRIRKHASHVKEVSAHCTGEETTKQALILPLLDILGFSPYDPLKVKAEHYADVPGVKRSERVDYALFSEGEPVMFIEAKAAVENLGNHAPQLARYFNATPGVCVTALTNGLIWKFFTDLQERNIMDREPFFIVDFTDLKDTDIQELSRFTYGNIRPDHLRTFAEDQTYFVKFKEVILNSLRDMDPDFVRFVATKALPNMRMTQKTIESITPLVKRALGDAMSGLVMNSLNIPSPVMVDETPIADVPSNEALIDPSNPNIITTAEEKRLLEIGLDLLKGRIEENELSGKDTETYYSLLYKGKSNRWLLRYNINRRRPIIQFCLTLTEQHRSEILRAGLEIGTNDTIYLDSPEHLARIPGLVFDALNYCRNDDNFKRSSAAEAQENQVPA